MTKNPRATARTAARTADKPAGSLSAGRLWLFRLAALVIFPLLLLGGGELGLRLAGYGYPTGFFREITVNGHELLVDNDQFGLRFFPPSLARFPAPVVMNARKPAGTYRIFIFGESAALGDPQPNYGAGRYLEVLLRGRFPEAKFEIVNTSITAINSHVILPIARECAGLQGDCWLVYMGNNEMVGPFGAATVFGKQAPSLAFARFSLAIQETRVGQFLTQVSRRLRKSSAESSSWHGMEMFLKNRIPPRDARKEKVYQNFQANLGDILRAGTESGARIILSTVAVNQRDCPPFASLSSADASAAERNDYEQACTQGAAAMEQGDWERAATNYGRAAAIFSDSADVQFRLGTSLLRMTNAQAARGHLQLAVDKDLLPFRADSKLNGLIRGTGSADAKDKRIQLCDAAARLGTNSPAGVPGRESFYEHVHLNFTGNYRLARLWADEIAKDLHAALTRGAAADWASQEQCERWLGLTDWNRASVVEEVIGRLNQPPFTQQAGNAQQKVQLRAWADELKQRMAQTPPGQARALYEEALRLAPEDHGLHENFAEFLEAIGDDRQATVERRKVCELIPHYYFSYYSLGCLLKKQGQLAEAQECLKRAAALNPRSGEVRLQLGMVYGRNNQWDLALSEFEQARRFNPEDPRALLYSGEVLRKLNRRSEAITNFQEAVRLEPGYWEAHYRLGEELALEGSFSEAADEFRETVKFNPQYLKGRVSLAAALLNLRRHDEAVRQLDEVLRNDPQNRDAQMLWRQATGRADRP